MTERKSLEEFALFLETWNMLQGFKTPLVHTRIVDWLQSQWDQGETKMLLMAFRSCGKSTLIGLFCAWLLWRDPDLRILVLSAESSLAGKMVRNVKRIIETHPFTKMLKPKHPDQWASDRFTVLRDVESRDPSVLAAGISGNITGARADLIIYDDVEVPNTCDSADKRENLRERLNESAFTLSSGGRQVFIGTPHSYFSIYADAPRVEINEEKAFLEGFNRLKVPLLEEGGESAWPERYTKKDVDEMRHDRGPQKFASQMMLEPKNIDDARLDTSLLRFYDDPLEDHEAQGQLQLKIGDVRMVSASAWWDPSFGAAKGDSSVLAIIYADAKNNRYVHHVEYIKIETNSDVDEARAQCEIVANLIHQYFLPSVAIEINGIGQFLPGILKMVLKEKQLTCAVLQKHSHTKKETRILEGFDAIMAAKSLYVHKAVKQTPLLIEMSEWQPNRANNKDDGLDAVAGALSLESMRFGRGSYGISNKKNWMGSSQTFKAPTDFDI